MQNPECHIIAGPNGAGKTTFAMEFLPNEARGLALINADTIAWMLSPHDPALAAIEAGKIMLGQIENHVRNLETFAFESTLSGRGYERRIMRWKSLGYTIAIYYLRLPNVDMSVQRVRERVTQGGHNILEEDIRRRFARGSENFEGIYKPLADRWSIHDSSQNPPRLIEDSSHHG